MIRNCIQRSTKPKNSYYKKKNKKNKNYRKKFRIGKKAKLSCRISSIKSRLCINRCCIFNRCKIFKDNCKTAHHHSSNFTPSTQFIPNKIYLPNNFPKCLKFKTLYQFNKPQTHRWIKTI
jgi:hypothetical protein